jgi:hypothetical protein
VKWVNMLCSVDRGSAAASPRHPGFTSAVLEPLAHRHAAGEDGRQLSVELYNTIHPWALSFAVTQSAGLPAHADRNEVLSQVLRITWDACLHIDWKQYTAWTAFLDHKVSRARIEAARSDDWLTRRERVRRRTFHRELARREQVAQRTLTNDERCDIAVTIAPASARVDWAQTLLNARHPSSVADVPDVADSSSTDATTTEEQVEDRELGGIRTRCLAEWLTIVGAENRALVADLSRWSGLSESADRDLPARLARRLEPYTRLLLTMLGDAA